ncbi:ThuA domain-containing protein [Cohnella fermenti]|uniref:Trehalose utilization protein ThuA n=1 Tax=Cohnella fermenti TaxID=2565925 RepID=A0A4S4BHA6_9BACL|nr:ThuA domain-containing protein [Cohnella fermenti]THF72824.1 trehalose utilization protein ThuA [Cohnella fermenti]
MSGKLRVTIWNEYRHEANEANTRIRELYPEGIHRTIAGSLEGSCEVRTATLDEPEHGLGQAVLNETDVLIWWGHVAHHEVADDIVNRVHERVLNGMGLIVLHSGHYSKIFKKLMGTSCSLRYRAVGEKERLWVVSPGHPIAEGIEDYFELQQEEMYGEFFDVPQPDEVVFVSWFEGGEVFRSGCCYNRGQGKLFYFRPGHETYPTYHNDNVQRVLNNAVRWAAPPNRPAPKYGKRLPALEPIKPRG